MSSRCRAVRGRTTARTSSSRPSRSEHVAEQRVAVAVVQRHVGWRSDDDEHPLGVEPERIQHGGVGLEARQRVLLLQARVAAHLRSDSRRVRRVAPAGSRRGRSRDEPPVSRARAGRARTRSRTRTTEGMPRERATSGSSCDAWDSARSKSRPFANPRSAWSRPAIARPLPIGAGPAMARSDDVVLDLGAARGARSSVRTPSSSRRRRARAPGAAR